MRALAGQMRVVAEKMRAGARGNEEQSRAESGKGRGS
jgi:hypothetical protein